MRIYKQNILATEYSYSFELPDNWTTKSENDGEHKWIEHCSPAGSRLRFTVTYQREPRPEEFRKAYAGITDPDVYKAYMLADSESIARESIISWIFRKFLHRLGWRVRLNEETLGYSRGFTFDHGDDGKIGWYGWFAQFPVLIRVAFQPKGSQLSSEINLARNIVASFKVALPANEPE